MAGSYLDTSNIDDLGRMVTALLTELWITRDRLAVVEALLEEKIGLSAQEIDDYTPAADIAARIEKVRDRLVGNVVGAPLAARERGVDQILARAGLTRPQPN